MMKNFILFTACSFLFMQPGLADRPKVAIQLLIDDSGTLTDPETAEQYKQQVFHLMNQYKKVRRFSRSQISVISTAYGRTKWIGNLSDLKSNRAHELLKVIKAAPDRCNNLTGAFKELRTNLRHLTIEGYKEVHIYVFSSLIHTPVPCTGAEITLPQPPPLSAGVNKILTSSESISSVTFYWINPHQKRVWLDYLEPTINWLKAKNGRFNFLDISNSIYRLQKGLEGVQK
ncbi:MAG: hypothetical protein AB2669_11875 [Candidatus Thiodiazotropha endolucinida]